MDARLPDEPRAAHAGVGCAANGGPTMRKPSFRFLLTVLVVATFAAAHAAPLRIVATDAGFEAPLTAPAGLRHVVFENRGTTIHEAMFVRLPDGMDAAGYVAEVKRGELFPDGALDRSGPGL